MGCLTLDKAQWGKTNLAASICLEQYLFTQRVLGVPRPPTMTFSCVLSDRLHFIFSSPSPTQTSCKVHHPLSNGCLPKRSSRSEGPILWAYRRMAYLLGGKVHFRVMSSLLYDFWLESGDVLKKSAYMHCTSAILQSCKPTLTEKC